MDKMPDEIYTFHDDNDYDDSGAWSVNHEGNDLDKYISEQKHAEEIAALRAEHRAEMAGLCDEIERLSNYVAAFNTDVDYKVVLAELSEIKQRISDE